MRDIVQGSTCSCATHSRSTKGQPWFLNLSQNIQNRCTRQISGANVLSWMSGMKRNGLSEKMACDSTVCSNITAESSGQRFQNHALNSQLDLRRNDWLIQTVVIDHRHFMHNALSLVGGLSMLKAFLPVLHNGRASRAWIMSVPSYFSCCSVLCNIFSLHAHHLFIKALPLP